MNRTSSLLRGGLALGLGLLLALTAAAQGGVTTTAPIKVDAPKPRKESFKAEVLHMTRVAITVRSRDNLNHVRTFTFNQKLAGKMGKLMDNQKAYQHGDRVKIVFLEGTDTAVKIKGKPGQNR